LWTAGTTTGQHLGQQSADFVFAPCDDAADQKTSFSRSLFQHIRVRGVAGLVAIHVPMGGYRRPVEAKILQGLGAAKGVPDVLLWHAGKSYAIELKSNSGRVSESQAAMLDWLDKAGVATAVAHGIDQAVSILEGWQLLKNRAV
jgi:hypothetical protein